MAPLKLSSVKNIQSGNSLTSSPKQNSDGTIFVNIFINGTAVQAILDTGSPITIIPKSVFEQLEHSDEICENKKSEPLQSESKIFDKPVSPYLPPTYEHFDENQQDQLNTLLLEFSDIFANSPEELG